MARKSPYLNQYRKTYNKEPLRTYKEIISLAWEGMFRFIMQEVGKGRTQEDIGRDLGMTRANVNRIVQRMRKRQKMKAV
jgi:DNA-binding MarR family transcriptional regulator